MIDWCMDEDYSLINIDRSDEKRVQVVDLKQNDMPTECPMCGSEQTVIHKPNQVTTLRDFYGDRPSIIHIHRDRRRCKQCGKTFFPGKPLPDRKMSDSFINSVLQELLSDKSKKNSTVGRKYGVSKSTVSKIANDFLEEKGEQTRSVDEDCNIIFFYPFEYEHRLRCAVIGDGDFQDKRLLCILNNYDQQEICRFCKEKVCQKDSVEYTFSAADRMLLDDLHGMFPEAVRSVLIEYSQYLIDNLSVDMLDGLFSKKLEALKEFRRMLRNSNSASFANNFTKWHDALKDGLDLVLSQLIYLVESCLPEWENACDYSKEETDCKQFLELIGEFRSHNVPFEMMKLRIMYATDLDYATDPNAFYYGINGRNCIRSKCMMRYGVPLRAIIDYFNK